MTNFINKPFVNKEELIKSRFIDTDLEKGKSVPIGTKAQWKDGKTYEKTAKGWRVVKSEEQGVNKPTISSAYHEAKFREHDNAANELHPYVGGVGSNHEELMKKRDFHIKEREKHRKLMIAASKEETKQRKEASSQPTPMSEEHYKQALSVVKKHIPSSHKLDAYDHESGGVIFHAPIKQTGAGKKGSSGHFIGDSWSHPLNEKKELHSDLKNAGFDVKTEKNKSHIIVSKNEQNTSQASYGSDMSDKDLSERLEFHQRKEKEAKKAGKTYDKSGMVRALEKEWSKRNAEKASKLTISSAYGDSKFSSKEKAINPSGKLTKPENYSVLEMKDGSFVRTTNNRASQFEKQGDGKIIGGFLSNQKFYPNENTQKTKPSSKSTRTPEGDFVSTDKNSGKSKNTLLKNFESELKAAHEKGEGLIDSQPVQKVLNKYMDMDTDLFDSDDLNEIVDKYFP